MAIIPILIRLRWSSYTFTPYFLERNEFGYHIGPVVLLYGQAWTFHHTTYVLIFQTKNVSPQSSSSSLTVFREFAEILIKSNKRFIIYNSLQIQSDVSVNARYVLQIVILRIGLVGRY